MTRINPKKKTKKNYANNYYGSRRRYFKLSLGRASRVFKSGAYQYRRWRGTMYFELKSQSTGTASTVFGLYDMTNYSRYGVTFKIEDLLTSIGDFASIGGYFTQYKIRGVKVQCLPGNNNFHRNQSEDAIVMVGLQNVNSTSQDLQPDFGAAIQTNSMLVCSPFTVVTKYIPVHMDWINTFTPFNVRIACTQNKQVSLSYSPNYYVRFDFYVTFRGNSAGKKLVIDAAQTLGHN